jgi:hypothetical protein
VVYFRGFGRAGAAIVLERPSTLGCRERVSQ